MRHLISGAFGPTCEDVDINLTRLSSLASTNAVATVPCRVGYITLLTARVMVCSSAEWRTAGCVVSKSGLQASRLYSTPSVINVRAAMYSPACPVSTAADWMRIGACNPMVCPIPGARPPTHPCRPSRGSRPCLDPLPVVAALRLPHGADVGRRVAAHVRRLGCPGRRSLVFHRPPSASISHGSASVHLSLSLCSLPISLVPPPLHPARSPSYPPLARSLSFPCYPPGWSHLSHVPLAVSLARCFCWFVGLLVCWYVCCICGLPAGS